MSESDEQEPGNGAGIDDLFDTLPGPLDDGDDVTAEEEEEPSNPTDVDDLFDVLSSPLDDGNDITAVLTRRPRAKVPSLTLVLAAIVVASAGFLGGALVGKHYGSSSSGNLSAAFSRFAARASASTSGGTGATGGTGGTGSGSGGRGGLFGGGNATVGTIKLIDGGTVYVQTTAGDIVQVATSAGTKVTVSSTVPVTDLRPGETVIVEGSKNSSGAIAATSISQTSAGGFGGFGG